ncbi:MAG: hypothetical protein GYB31_19995 [Bacteroidetes bacterium]|nr:hypothetical protein [Bacteroidota bacterium]
MDKDKSVRYLQTIFMATIGALVMILVVIFFTLQPEEGWAYNIGDMTVFLAVVLLFAGWVFSKQVYTRRLQGVNTLEMEKKVEHYRISAMLRLALQEFPVFAALGLFIAFGNAAVLFAFAIGLVLFIQSRPSMAEFERDYMI